VFPPASVAVDDVSFQAEEGEFVVLLGPSGCGKTTTLRCLAGFERPDRGRIAIGGEVVDDPQAGRYVPPQRRDIGMVFQSYAIWPHMTVGRNVSFPLEVRRLDRRTVSDRVRSALALVGLEGLEDRPASDVSGGQQQRIALARALVYDPRLLLLDEPLSNLDAQMRARLRFELKEVQRRASVTAVYVTHDQSEAVVLGDRVLVLNHGRVEQLGSPADLYDRPETYFVASFTGTDNLLDGTLTSVQGGEGVVRTDAGLVASAAIPRRQQPRVGARVCLAFRGENVGMRAGDTPAEGENEWDGAVVSATFLGLQTRYRVKVKEEALIAVRSGSKQEYGPGDRVVLTLSTESGTILERGGDAPAMAAVDDEAGQSATAATAPAKGGSHA
jgi:iron(III) transport system ATP-binding protein